MSSHVTDLNSCSIEYGIVNCVTTADGTQVRNSTSLLANLFRLVETVTTSCEFRTHRRRDSMTA